MALLGLLLAARTPGRPVAGSSQLWRADSVSETEAAAVAEVLGQAAYFVQGGQRATVRREEGRLVLAVQLPNTELTEDVVSVSQSLADALVAEVGGPARVELCNELWMAHRHVDGG